MSGGVSRHVHGTALVLGEHGLLIRGPSGAGKTSLATSLIHEAAPRGLFVRLVGDDRVAIEVFNGRVVVRAHTAIAGLIEHRGCGIAAVPFERAAVLALVIDLGTSGGSTLPRMPAEADRTTLLLGVRLPRLAVPDPYNRAASAIIFEQVSRFTRGS